jgi:TPR repeat protein
MKMAETQDPNELARWNVRGVKPDPAEAKRWYQRALELKASEAEARLRRLAGQ